MTSDRVLRITRLIATLTLLQVSVMQAQESGKLTVEWMYSQEAAEAAATPAFKWLGNGKCVLYDRQKPSAERTLEIYDPEEGSRTPLINETRAISSLAQFLKTSTPRSLPFPVDIDGTGDYALYVFDKDLFLLKTDSAAFTRITHTVAEEKCASFSPDGRKIAFVRSNDMYVYDIRGQRELRLTSDESDSVLNGTLSWVYWEEVFGRHDTGYWWSPDSRAIAYSVRTKRV